MSKLYIFLELQQFLCQFRYGGQFLLSDDDFALELADFDRNHSDIIFKVFNGYLGLAKNVFLNIGLFIEDAQFIISVDELDTCVVSVFTGLFVLEPETLHVFL